MRLDVFLTEKGYEKSRERAQTLIKSGKVKVGGIIISKPAFDVSENAEITIIEALRFVSRGGEKLSYALEKFGIDIKDKKCLDIGSSTGGFTDCLLQNGAKSVICVDVGSNQLDETIRADRRVTVYENMDIRKADPVTFDDVDFLTCDVSFISLKLLLPAIKNFIKKGEGVFLIKPQFELTRKNIGKGGIVKNTKLRETAVKGVTESMLSNGFRVINTAESFPHGTDGNIEYSTYVSFG
ncbi:MAG: TlyA family RNA methyltransferase [Ruminococcus sp.]|jgi:23S rRNA (cytidine1920-2'-O)/16S rRNA (cytidine1409-2'-O)-methyltransferase|nr:TlyA family RNA methyltransferase [Ruminococcus sp.]